MPLTVSEEALHNLKTGDAVICTAHPFALPTDAAVGGYRLFL